MNPIVAVVLIWVATIILSYWMELYVALHLIKEFAKNGWLINTKKMPYSNNSAYKSIVFIPIINILFGLFLGITYNKILQQMSMVCDTYADPMTDIEKERFKKKPTFITIATLLSDRDKINDLIKKETDRLNSLQQRLDDINDIANGYRVTSIEFELKKRETQRLLDEKKELLKKLKNGQISIDEYNNVA